MKRLIIGSIVLVTILYPQSNNEFENQLFNNTNDEIVETDYTDNNSYSRDSRDFEDILSYDLPWEAWFWMEPGDVMVTTFQMDTSGIISGVNVPVYLWGTNSDGEELEVTVSIHRISYPYGSDSVMYDQSSVNSSGWL